MSIDRTAQGVRQLLADQIESFRRRRDQNKRRAFTLYLAATLLSAGVTVLLGLQGLPESAGPYIRNAALVMSTAVTILTGIDTFFNHRALWVRYTQTFAQLRALQTELDQRTPPLSQAYVDDVFQRMQQILGETNSWWQQQRAEEATKSKGQARQKPPEH